jgi:hypothetical protein
MPWVQPPSRLRPEGPRDRGPEQAHGRFLAALQAAWLFASSSQGIGLRPQPWAMFYRPFRPGLQANVNPRRGFDRTSYPSRRRRFTVSCGMPENPAGRPESLRAVFVLCGTQQFPVRRRETLPGTVKLAGAIRNPLGFRQTLRPVARLAEPSRKPEGRRETRGSIFISGGTPPNSAAQFEILWGAAKLCGPP